MKSLSNERQILIATEKLDHFKIKVHVGTDTLTVRLYKALI